MRPTHASRLERWLGVDKAEELSRLTHDWYGPPIAVHGVPGEVYATRGGDFIGECRAGFEVTWLDRAEDFVKRLRRASRVCSHAQRLTMNAGFSSLSDLISEATTGGKRQEFFFQKSGSTGVTNGATSLWRAGSTPAAGGAGSAAPGGRALTDATTGGHPFANPTGGDTLHLVNGYSLSDANRTLLLYDRIFDVAKTMSSTATEAVTGVPTRYQNTTGGQPDSIAGNFLFVEVFAALGATAHNWTVCTYQDQANGASTLPSLTGNSSAIIDRLDHPLHQWFAPLESGDTGIMSLTQMQCSASVSGSINFVIGHPLAFMPMPTIGMVFQHDFINTAFNLTRIFDDACLALMIMPAPGSGSANVNAQVTAVAG